MHSPRRSLLYPLLLAVLAVAAGYLWGAALRRPAPLRVTFLDVGQGDSMVIETPSRRCLVVDTGKGGNGSGHAWTAVLPFLRTRGLHNVDALVLTHWDLDHAGGAQAILRGTSVCWLLIPVDGPWEAREDALKTSTLAKASERRVRVVRAMRGQRIQAGDGVVLDVLNPPSPADPFKPANDNDSSVVMLVRYGSTRILLTGDAGTAAESAMLRAGMDVRADVLKIAHHGSRTSTSSRWLKAVSPRLAVISVGQTYSPSLPAKPVLERLTKMNVRILRTDQDGAITVWTDGRLYHVLAQRRVNDNAKGNE